MSAFSLMVIGILKTQYSVQLESQHPVLCITSGMAGYSEDMFLSI